MEQDYFDSLMKDVIKDLKKTGSALVFNQEQVDFVQSKFKEKIKVFNDNGLYYLELDKK